MTCILCVLEIIDHNVEAIQGALCVSSEAGLFDKHTAQVRLSKTFEEVSIEFKISRKFSKNTRK